MQRIPQQQQQQQRFGRLFRIPIGRGRDCRGTAAGFSGAMPGGWHCRSRGSPLVRHQWGTVGDVVGTGRLAASSTGRFGRFAFRIFSLSQKMLDLLIWLWITTWNPNNIYSLT